MRKLKLRFALPTAQLAVAMSLMYWGEHHEGPPHSDETFCVLSNTHFASASDALFGLSTWFGRS